MNQTERLRAEYEDVIARARELVGRYDERTLQHIPAEGSWSAAECLEHLAVTAESYSRRIRRLLESAPKRPAKREARTTLVGRLFTRILEPPVRRKFPAPKTFMPTAIRPREELLARFEATHGALMELIDQTDGIDRGRIKVPSPAASFLRMNLVDAFMVLAAHARRHLWQADRAARA